MQHQKYKKRYSITAGDMDVNYRITPKAVLLYYQDCWACSMGKIHLAAFDIVKQNMLWVITEFVSIFDNYDAFWSEEIEVTVWNSELTPLRLYTEFEVRKTNDNTLISHGYASWSLLEKDTHKLVPTSAIADKLTIIPELVTDGHKKQRFKQDGELCSTINHKVNRINLDFNGHVNNRTYLDIAMQTPPKEIISTQQVNKLRIHWLQETFMGETLTCKLLKTDEDCYLATINKDDGTQAAQIYSEWCLQTYKKEISTDIDRT
ncbi:MAG: hypothetical protein IKN91_04555 [Paludibacteraceae bacterium]|nr:hypothetical protein [Paludibacteraceae bacterium]